MDMKMNISELRKYPRVGQQFNDPAGESAGSQRQSFAPPRETASQSISQQVEALAKIRAEEIVREQEQARILARNGRTFTKFNPVDDIIDNQTEIVTAGLWSDGLASLTTHYSASNLSATQKTYYTNVYQSLPTESGSAVQYSIAYGHALGSGSYSSGQLNDSSTRAIYSQYKQLLLEQATNKFSTPDGTTDSIYVINFKRNRMKDKIDEGNFEIPLANIATRATNATGSVTVGSTVHTLIDDSSISSGTIGISGRVYNVVSGSINDGVFNSSAPIYYGKVYPDHGVVILNGTKLDSELSFTTSVASSIEANNHFLLYRSISGSGALGNGFLARNSETVTSTHYFVRVKNAEYNFSNNPSFTTGSVGEFAQTTFVGDPKVYITTIGLYNDQRELLATAKLSQPRLKSFSNELNIRVKLDF